MGRLSKIEAFFAAQPFKYSTLCSLNTDWFDITKPEMLPELEKIKGMEFNHDKTKCRIVRKFNRIICKV